MNLTLVQLKKPAEKGDINYLVDFLMEKEMVNGSSGMIMDRLKSKANIIVVKSMVNGPFGTTMAKPKNKAHLVLVKQTAYINIGLIMVTLNKSNGTKKDQLMVDGPNGIKKIQHSNMSKMEIGNIKTVSIKMKTMNYGVGGGI